MTPDGAPGPGSPATVDYPVQSRRVRSDARRNASSLLSAASEVFKQSGVDAPVREIAERAGVGVGTLYRHFPKRSDLIAAVFRVEVDDCAAAAAELARQHPGDSLGALTAWLHRYMDFIVTKRGLAAALHTGDPAYSGLHDYFDDHLDPALDALLEAAVEDGEIRADFAPHTILHAVRSLCLPDDDGSIDHVRPVINLLIDGLRLGAPSRQTA